MGRSVPLESPQPSQLYVDADRLRNALEWFDVDDPTYDPCRYSRSTATWS